jgi:flagellar hook-associated protein 3 FlgL
VITRISDAQTFAFLTERVGRLQVQLNDLQQQIASGRRLLSPEQDPLGAAQVVRSGQTLAALGQYGESTRFGVQVLGAEDDAVAQAEQLMVRAREIATQQASGLLSPAERAAAREEVHGILEGLTMLGNSELAGRRLFGGLALDAPPPFADPDAGGYTAATAYGGSSATFQLRIGAGTAEQVRVSTRGDQVFGAALQSVEALEQTLAANGDTATTLAGLEQASGVLAAERASVGARQTELLARADQVSGQTVAEQHRLADVRDADITAVVTALTQAQTALQATLAAGVQIAQTSLVNLLRLA